MKTVKLFFLFIFFPILINAQTDTIRFYKVGSSSFSENLALQIKEMVEASGDYYVTWTKAGYTRMDQWADQTANYWEWKAEKMPTIRAGNFDFMIIQTISWFNLAPEMHDSLFKVYLPDLRQECDDLGIEIILYDKYPSPGCYPDYKYSNNLFHVMAAVESGVEKIGFSGSIEEELNEDPYFRSLEVMYNAVGHPGAMQNYMSACNVTYQMTGISPVGSSYTNIPMGFMDWFKNLQYSSDPDEVALFNDNVDRVDTINERLQLRSFEWDTLQKASYANVIYWDSIVQANINDPISYQKIIDTIEYYYSRHADFDNFNPKDIGPNQVERCRDIGGGFTFDEIQAARDSTKLFSDRVEYYANLHLDSAGYEQLRQDYLDYWDEYNNKFRDDVFYMMQLTMIDKKKDSTPDAVEIARLEEQHDVFLEVLSLPAEKLLMERISPVESNNMISTFSWASPYSDYAPNFGQAQLENVSLWSEVEVIRNMYTDIWLDNDLMDELRDNGYQQEVWLKADSLFQLKYDDFTPGYRLLEIAAENGAVNIVPDQVNYAVASDVALTAVPDAGFFFSDWEGDLSGSTNPITVVMDDNKTIAAIFKPIETIIDNDDPVRVEITGGVITRNDIGGQYGADVYKLVVSDVNEVKYVPDLTGMDGEFEIYTWLPSGGVTGVPYKVTHATGTDTVYIDQTAASGDWYLVGTFDLLAGNYVIIDANTISGGRGYADAMKFVRTNVDPPVETYSLSITANNGTVTKDPSQTFYEKSTVVNLTATPNTGYEFTSWSGDATGTANPISVTMDDNKSVTANFAPLTYSITFNVTDGTDPIADAAITFNSETINTDASGDAIFNSVAYGTGLGYSISKSGYNSVSGSVDVSANATENITLSLATNPTYAVTITNGTGSGNYEEGATVNVTADVAPAGHEFDTWTGDVSVLSDATVASSSFTMPDNAVSLTATYKDLPPATYTVSITNGTGSGDYSEGATVIISANAAPIGQEFDQWTGDISLLSSATTNASSFTMPASDVNLTATYKDLPLTTYTVTIVNGTGSGNYEEAETITIIADAAPTGQEFSHWSGDNQYLDDNIAATATLTVPALDVTITAVYQDIVNDVTERKLQVTIYPIPVSTTLNILSKQNISSIKVLDVSGKTIYKGNDSGNEMKLDVSRYEKGMYFIVIHQQNQQNQTYKFIVE